jgi:hypothetical protein
MTSLHLPQTIALFGLFRKKAAHVAAKTGSRLRNQRRSIPVRVAMHRGKAEVGPVVASVWFLGGDAFKVIRALGARLPEQTVFAAVAAALKRVDARFGSAVRLV